MVRGEGAGQLPGGGPGRGLGGSLGTRRAGHGRLPRVQRGATFVRGGSLAAPAGTRRLRGAEHPGERPGLSRGPAAAAMDIPPLAGKIAALSLSALPVSYALNHVSALSQCVRGGAGAAFGDSGGGRRLGGTEVGWREDAPSADLAPASPVPQLSSDPAGLGLGQKNAPV